RCCDKKSCGNRNETPSDPVIIDRPCLLGLPDTVPKVGMGTDPVGRPQPHLEQARPDSATASKIRKEYIKE
ncbi:UNVERIFIED_CONTAM: hypothetical protein K2H54_006450, partial [Gekko kuhli]